MTKLHDKAIKTNGRYFFPITNGIKILIPLNILYLRSVVMI